MFTIINGIEIDLHDYINDEKIIADLEKDEQFINDISFGFEKEFSMADEDVTGGEILNKVIEKELKRRKEEKKIVKLNYRGEDSWNRPVYEVGNTGTYVKDVDLGRSIEPSLCWSSPKSDPDGEPDYPFKAKEGTEVIFMTPKKQMEERENAKFVIAKMIASNEYKEGKSSVEWLDHAAGIHDLKLTKLLLQELKEKPLDLVYDQLDGWKLASEKDYYKVTYEVSDGVHSSNIVHAMNEEDIKNYYGNEKKKEVIDVSRVAKWEVEVALKKGMPVIEVATDKEKQQAAAMEALKEWNLNGDDRFRYQMLSRLQMDCDYYLGNGNHFAGHLWADSEKEQVEIMKHLYNSFSDIDKPEWISMEDIEGYEKDMVSERSLDEKIQNAEMKCEEVNKDGQKKEISNEIEI